MGTPLGDYLRYERARRGWTQADLAARANLSKSHMSQLESGKIAVPNEEVRRALATALGVTHLDIVVAAGVLDRDRDIRATVTGVVERNPDDPKEQVIALLRETELPAPSLDAIRWIVEAWHPERVRDRTSPAGPGSPVPAHQNSHE